MNFEFRGHVYNVRWQYGEYIFDEKIDGYRVKRGTENRTYCMVQNVDTKEVNNFMVKRFYLDPQNKDKGRKESLALALQVMGMTKSERIAVWEVYRTSKPGGRWKASEG